MRPLLLLIAVMLTLAQATQADPFLIVPGRSIGRTRLGRNGGFYLKRLPPPTGADGWLGGNLGRAWQAKHGTGTLYIHTFSNGFLDPPQPGVAIREIRVTSRRFHTQNGAAVGMTLAQIRRRFPSGYVTSAVGDFYRIDQQGIAFAFMQRPTPIEPCIAISVFSPDTSDQAEMLATIVQVRDILHNGQHL